MKEGIPQRFCQQCGRFHHLDEFDGDKRSCRCVRPPARPPARLPVGGFSKKVVVSMMGLVSRALGPPP